MAVLVINDHALKARWPGLVTGKLSDVAGLVYFPLLLASIFELVMRWTPKRRWSATPTVVLICAGVTAVGFAAVKVSATARAGYLRLVEATTPISHQITPDATDLVALPSVLAAWMIARAGHQCGDATRRASTPGEDHEPVGHR